MRILQITASLDPVHGGPPDGILRLSEAWQAQGHTTCVVTLDHPGAPYLQGLPMPVAPIGPAGDPQRRRGRNILARYRYSPAMVPWLRQHLPDWDMVVVHGLWNYAAWAAQRALIGAGKPVFVFPHGSLDPWFKAAYPLKSAIKRASWLVNEGRLMNGATAVLFTTGAERDLARNVYTPYHVHPEVVGFGSIEAPAYDESQREAFYRLLPQLKGRRFILFLSRIHLKKGCDLLIAAFAKIAASQPDLDLLIVGPDEDGLQAGLMAQAQSLGVAERIHWPGSVSGAAKWGAYRLAEVFALTSHSENFGIVVAEALSCSLPVLITDKVNIWQEVAADGAGLVETDTQDGADALLRRWLALDAAQRTAMAAAARRCYETHFRIETTAARIVEVARKHGAEG